MKLKRIALIAVICLSVFQGAFAAPAKTLPTRQEWERRAGASAVWPPARMSDDELQIWVDFLIEEGHSYGEYLNFRLQARHARDAFSAVGLLARAEELYHQHWREWIEDLPVDSVLRDRRGLIRGVQFKAHELREFAAAGGQERLESKGLDWLDIPGDHSANDQLNDADVALIAGWRLTGLNLFKNRISDAGARLLAQNKTLEYLELGRNWVRDPGVIALLKSKSLEALSLWRNSLSDAVLVELGSNHVVKRIDLGGNMISDAGLTALEKNNTIEELILGENHYTADGVASLLRINRALKYVGLSPANAQIDCERLLTQGNPIVTQRLTPLKRWWPE